MSEGKIYVCHWIRRKGKFEARVDALPDDRVTAKTFDEMVDAIGGLLIEKLGDGEPQLEFEPPYIDVAGTKSVLKNEWVSTFIENAVGFAVDHELFTGGFCTWCRYPIGQRTAKPLLIEFKNREANSKSLGVVCEHATRLPLVRAEVLDLFTAPERDLFEARPTPTNQPKMRWFEIIPHHVVATVAGKTLKPGGWICRTCGRQHISHSATLGWGPEVVTRESLPTGSDLFVGDPGNVNLCFTKDRWAALKGQLRAAGLTSGPIGIIAAAESELNPPLRDREAGSR